MSGIFALLKGFRPPRVGLRSLKAQGVNLDHVRPVYDCGKLPWWARWTYFLVIADLVVTASACELTLNHWSMWEELPQEENAASTPDEPPTNPDNVVGHYVPRPLWQRGLFTLANLAGGVGLAAVLLGGRSRVVRKMFIIPPAASQNTSAATAGLPPSERLLVIQSPLHTKGQGVVMPLRRTRLVHSSEKTEMLIGLKDRRGHYSLGLQGAEIDGQKLSIWDGRKHLFVRWYGEKKGMQMFLASAKVKEET